MPNSVAEACSPLSIAIPTCTSLPLAGATYPSISSESRTRRSLVYRLQSNSTGHERIDTAFCLENITTPSFPRTRVSYILVHFCLSCQLVVLLMHSMYSYDSHYHSKSHPISDSLRIVCVALRCVASRSNSASGSGLDSRPRCGYHLSPISYH